MVSQVFHFLRRQFLAGVQLELNLGRHFGSAVFVSPADLLCLLFYGVGDGGSAVGSKITLGFSFLPFHLHFHILGVGI